MKVVYRNVNNQEERPHEELLRRAQREEVTDGGDRDEPLDFESLAESTLPPIDPEKQLQNILDCILPPRCDSYIAFYFHL